MLDIVANYHCMQFQGKHMIQTQANGEKLHFGPDLDPLNQIQASNFFVKNLAASVTKYQGKHVRYQHVRYQKKLMIQS